MSMLLTCCQKILECQEIKFRIRGGMLVLENGLMDSNFSLNKT